jgi:hypothetical protein
MCSFIVFILVAILIFEYVLDILLLAFLAFEVYVLILYSVIKPLHSRTQGHLIEVQQLLKDRISSPSLSLTHDAALLVGTAQRWILLRHTR